MGLCREHAADKLGISWECFGATYGLRWEYFGIDGEYFGHIAGIRKNYAGLRRTYVGSTAGKRLEYLGDMSRLHTIITKDTQGIPREYIWNRKGIVWGYARYTQEHVGVRAENIWKTSGIQKCDVGNAHRHNREQFGNTLGIQLE